LRLEPLFVYYVDMTLTTSSERIDMNGTYGFTFDPHGWEDGFDLESGDASDDTYCESCDSTVDYSDGSKYGKCKCDDGGPA